MIIRNFKSLSTNTSKKDVLSIIEAGLEAALPRNSLEKIIKNDCIHISGKKINLKKYDRVFVIAVGKAAYSMTRAVKSFTCIDGGLLVVPMKTKTGLGRKFKVIQAGHPVPNKNSVMAAKNMLEFLNSTGHNDFVIFLISGGTSSLVALPDGISLREKQIVTNLMLKCGANIHEINCIRKHLSKIKGGRLPDYLRSDAVSLVMSDVVGDDLSSIASGMTYFDKTTFGDAKKILKKYNLESFLPKSVLQHIDLGVKGKVSETPKREKIKNYVISNNKNCLDAMNAKAKDLGFSTKIQNCISGDVKDIGMKMAKIFYRTKVDCVIFGGETTVVVKGKGKGGRNQELVLHMVSNLAKQNRHAIIASVGTDGIDGTTDSAGAIWQTDKKIEKIKPYLEKNDSYHFFNNYGGLIFTGPTGTNLMDIGLVFRQ
jgi:hydroxypyruvate reductase